MPRPAPASGPSTSTSRSKWGRRRAACAATTASSPGDEGHAEPYLYVGPWSAPVTGELWNAEGFSGAELSYAELVAAPDQAAAAKDFLETHRDALVQYADHDSKGETT